MKRDKPTNTLIYKRLNWNDPLHDKQVGGGLVTGLTWLQFKVADEANYLVGGELRCFYK